VTPDLKKHGGGSTGEEGIYFLWNGNSDKGKSWPKTGFIGRRGLRSGIKEGKGKNEITVLRQIREEGEGDGMSKKKIRQNGGIRSWVDFFIRVESVLPV